MTKANVFMATVMRSSRQNLFLAESLQFKKETAGAETSLIFP